jgi:hypothetical protein
MFMTVPFFGFDRAFLASGYWRAVISVRISGRRCRVSARGGNDIAIASLFLPLDLIADHAANGCTTYRANCAATGQYSTKDGACTGTDRRIFILAGHAGATRHANHEGNRRPVHCHFFYRVHM